jgi:hypothetical protein
MTTALALAGRPSTEAAGGLLGRLAADFCSMRQFAAGPPDVAAVADSLVALALSVPGVRRADLSLDRHRHYQLAVEGSSAGPASRASGADSPATSRPVQAAIFEIRSEDRAQVVGQSYVGCSRVCYQLELPDEHAATLILDIAPPPALRDECRAAELLLVACAEAMMGAAIARERAQNLEIALQTNRRIGMAIGVLMGQHKLTDEQAFDALRHASQHQDRKLRDVADEVIWTGALPATAEKSPHATDHSRFR